MREDGRLGMLGDEIEIEDEGDGKLIEAGIMRKAGRRRWEMKEAGKAGNLESPCTPGLINEMKGEHQV